MSLSSFLSAFLGHGTKVLLYPGAFLPHPREVRRPPIPYEDITLTTSDNVKIRAYLLLHPAKPKPISDGVATDTPSSERDHSPTSDGRPVILMFHGNLTDIGETLTLALPFFRVLDEGCNVLMLSPRGYGLSDGIPSTEGLQRDSEAAFNFLMTHPRLSASPKIIFGQSMGGALAIDLASKHSQEVSALIVENTFMSLRKLILDKARVFAIIAPSFRQWNSEDRISKIPTSMPMLMLSGLQDVVIPPSHMKGLWAAANPEGASPKRVGELVEIPWGGHNDTCLKMEYMPAVTKFIESLFIKP